MKKSICALLCISMLLCLCSCGGSKAKDGSSAAATSAESDIKSSDYSPSDVTSDKANEQGEYSVTRYYICSPGGAKKSTADVDYSADGVITVNFFDKNNYKTGKTVYDYDENGLVTRIANYDKAGKEKSYTLFDYNNLQKIDTEYYYEGDALRSTSRYTYNESGVLTEKTVEKVGDSAVYTWTYQSNEGKIYAVSITNDKNSNTEGYNFAENSDGRLYQKQHLVNGFIDDCYMYDYDENGLRNYRGYFNKSNELVEYYSFTYAKVNATAAAAFLGSGVLD